MHRTSFFVCTPIILFHLSIDLGRLVGSMPLRCQKNESLAPLIQHRRRPCVVDIVIIVFCRLFALRIAVYSYIYARLVDFQ
jgi:hypothetical protein